MPVIPSWLLEPLWDQFTALLPERPIYHPAHPLGCHRRRIPDRIVFDKLLQVLRFGCSYEAIADSCCSELGPMPGDIRVHLDAGYDSQKTGDELAGRGMTGQIARKGRKAPIQAGQRRPAGRTDAWHNAFNGLQRCHERREDVIGAFSGMADTIITMRSLIRQAWTAYRWDGRPARRP